MPETTPEEDSSPIEIVIPGDPNASPLKKVIRLVLVLLAIGAVIALLVYLELF